MNPILIVLRSKFLTPTTPIYTPITITPTSIFLHLTHHFPLPIHQNFINSLFPRLLIPIGTALLIPPQTTLRR
ncbi:YitT family protein, partial [Staphylococcus capitis]|uniref:YitT family protein n=1 Tax=Staphylococcus capitis TaxID=29388 RepID=UPI00370958CE